MRQRLEKEGIEDINEYQEEVKTITISDEMFVDRWKLNEEALDESTEASNSFLKIYEPSSDQNKDYLEDKPVVLD